MNILNLRSLISLSLLFWLVIFPALSQHQASASLGLPDDCLSPGRRSPAVGTEAIQFKKQPLRFEVNRGQSDAQVRFIARTADSTLFLTRSEAVLRLPKLEAPPDPASGRRRARKAKFANLARPIESAVLRLRPVNSNPQPRLTGLDQLPGVSNHFIGNDPRKWRTNIESYAKVKYENLYPGIDLIYYGNDAGEIEYDFKVAAGANPGSIALSIEGAGRVELDTQSGDLLLTTSVGRVRQRAPFLYQEVNGKRQEIAGHYRLLDSPSAIRDASPGLSSSAIRRPKFKVQNSLVAFEVGDYDKSKPLVIDPVVVYSTLLGGAAGNFDGASDVAVDAQGNAHIVGTTQASDFPIRNPFDGIKSNNSTNKAFVSKFAPDGSLIFSTFFGGNDSGNRGNALALDATGAIYVAGATAASDFPVKNAFQSTRGGSLDAFVAKLNAEGTAIIYSSFLGGNQIDDVKDLKLNAQNKAYIVGTIDGRGATSVTFPSVNPTQANYGGGDSDMFLSIVSSTGTSLLFSSFMGSNGDDEAISLSVSSDGIQIAIVHTSDGTDIATQGGISVSCDENKTILIAILAQLGVDVLNIDVGIKRWSLLTGRKFTCWELIRFLSNVGESVGSSQTEPGITPSAVSLPVSHLVGSGALATDGSGMATPSSVTPQVTGGGFDVIVAPVNQSGNPSIRGIFGGSRNEFVADAVTDSRGTVYVTGDTNSIDLPTVSPTQAALGSVNENGFVVVFAPNTYDVLFATYLGGDGFTLPQSIAVDPQGNIFVSGTVTSATTFPTTSGAFQRELKGSTDAFLVKYSPVEVPTGPDFSLSFAQSTVTTSFGKVKVAADINRSGGFTGNVTITPATPLPRGIILVGESVSTTENRVNFKLKVKASAALGTHQLSFAARDATGRTRTATLTLVVQ